ncbi:MAG: HAMP domain-containing histidine kinase [Myxococcales bacterium]|nr:HAMP domain-containing histidine kinase [Myxococcales bacterium]
MLAAPAGPSRSEPAPEDPDVHDALAVLVDGMQHDARNPLNAVAIHLEVLAERVRRESGAPLPPAMEKSVQAIRGQIQRVDAILRAFGDFIAPRAAGEEADLSAVAHKAVAVLGHEARRRRLVFRSSIEGLVTVRAAGAQVHELVLLALLGALGSAPGGTEIRVAVRKEGAEGVLRVEDASRGEAGVARRLRPAAERHGGRVLWEPGCLEVCLPLA